MSRNLDRLAGGCRQSVNARKKIIDARNSISNLLVDARPIERFARNNALVAIARRIRLAGWQVCPDDLGCDLVIFHSDPADPSRLAMAGPFPVAEDDEPDEVIARIVQAIVTIGGEGLRDRIQIRPK